LNSIGGSPTAPGGVVGVEGMPLAMLNAIPVPLFLVTRDVRLLWANDWAVSHLGVIRKYSRRHAPAELLHCFQTGAGCGSRATCEQCVIRRSVAAALGGQSVHQEKATLQLQAEGAVRDVHLLVTASPVREAGPDVALLIIQDISELIRLRSLIPICASCKRIRDDDQYWQSVEEHFRDRLDVDFSHGLCPECRRKLFPECDE